jgi:hypothetical protein
MLVNPGRTINANSIKWEYKQTPSSLSKIPTFLPSPGRNLRIRLCLCSIHIHYSEAPENLVVGMCGIERELASEGISYGGGTSLTDNTLSFTFEVSEFRQGPEAEAVLCGYIYYMDWIPPSLYESVQGIPVFA